MLPATSWPPANTQRQALLKPMGRPPAPGPYGGADLSQGAPTLGAAPLNTNRPPLTRAPAPLPPSPLQTPPQTLQEPTGNFQVSQPSIDPAEPATKPPAATQGPGRPAEPSMDPTKRMKATSQLSALKA